jgi:hypothetical protein
MLSGQETEPLSLEVVELQKKAPVVPIDQTRRRFFVF